MKEDKKDNAEWARLIYRHYMDCIEAVKRRQWAATNYIMLIFAAIIGYAKLYGKNDFNVYSIFSLLILVLLISIMGIYHILDMHFVITKYRIIIFNIAKKYPFARDIGMLEDKDAKFFKYFWSITFIFILFVIVGFTLVVLFLYNLIGNINLVFSIWNSILVLSRCSYLTLFLSVDVILAFVLTFYYRKKWKNLGKQLDKKRNNRK